MAPLVPFLNSILALLIFFSCAREKQTLRFVDVDIASVKQKAGFTYVNDSLFSGILFSLDSKSRDTIQISSFMNGKEHGMWKQYYGDGSLREFRYFENGRKQGEYLGWWPNGKKKFVFQFIDDEYNGTCYEWSENGELSHEANYIDGHEEGLQRAWYANGKIKSNYTIVNGRRYGLLGTKNCKTVVDSVFKR